MVKNERNYDSVMVLDFGSQYNQLITRRVREMGVYSELKPHTMTAKEIKAMNPKAVIFSGGPNSVNGDGALAVDPEIFNLGLPILGICYGMQIALIDIARNKLGFKDANSTEINPDTNYPIIDLLENQKDIKNVGGTLRLGNYDCTIEKDSLVYSLYGQEKIKERNIHRRRRELRERDKQKKIMSGNKKEMNVKKRSKYCCHDDYE